MYSALQRLQNASSWALSVCMTLLAVISLTSWYSLGPPELGSIGLKSFQMSVDMSYNLVRAVSARSSSLIFPHRHLQNQRTRLGIAIQLRIRPDATRLTGRPHSTVFELEHKTALC
jgi:hypothetical protein